MDFYIIPPVKHLELMHKGDRYFCLAQLYNKYESYRNFFKSLPEDAWITLDCGVGDYEPVTSQLLFDVMKDLVPNEVISLDVLFDSEETKKNAREFYEKMHREGLHESTEIFFCPQGNTQFEWIECYKWGLEQDWIQTLGLSKIAIPWAFLDKKGDVGIMESRHNCFNYLKVHGLLQKPLHLLGMGSPDEFKYYKQFEEGRFIRSSDSCNSIWSAMNHLSWERGQKERIKTPKDYFEREFNRLDQPVTADFNIRYLKSTVV